MTTFRSEEWAAMPALTPTASSRQVGGDHYVSMGDYQPWDVMRHWMTREEYRGYQKGVAIAYIARERQKGGDQDIKKAIHHLQKLMESIDSDQAKSEGDSFGL